MANFDTVKSAANNFKRFIENLVTFDDVGGAIPQSTLHQFNETLGLYPLSQFLPHQSFDPVNEIYTTQYGKAFLFQAEPLVGVDSAVVKNLHQIFQSQLPIGACGQIILNASNKIGKMLENYVDEREMALPVFKTIAKNRAKHAAKAAITSVIGEPYLLRDYNLYFSFSIDDDLGYGIDEVLDLKQKLASSLQTLNVKPRSVSATDFLQLSSQILRPTSNVFGEELVWDPKKSLNEQLTDPSYLRKITSVRVATTNSDWEIYTFRVKDYPLTPPKIWDMAQSIGEVFGSARLACPFTLSLIYKVVDSKDVIKGGEAQAFNADVRARERRGKSRAAEQDAQMWRDILSNKESGERILITNFQIQLACKRNEASQHISMLTNIFQSKMRWQIERNDLMHMATLLAHMPMSQTSALFDDFEALNLTHKMWAINAANIAPIIGEMKGANSYKVLLAGRRGQVMFWDPFANNRGNYNVAVVGGSGAGKSVFIQETAFAQLSTGGRVWVVDVGRSYYKMCKLFNGSFVVFNQESNLCLNPFSVANPDTLDSFFQFMVGFIYTMAFPGDISQPHEGWCRATITKVVQDVWAQSQLKNHRPDMQDVIDMLSQHDDPRGRDMAVQLYAFGRNGHHGKYFNGAGKLDFEGDFIVFELEEVSQDKHLQNLIFILLIHYVTEKMYLSDRKKRMSLIIDEAWDMLKGGHGGDIIESIARRARKYNGNLTTGTQGIGDYNASPAARAAWNNSYWQALLSQDKSSITKAVKDGLIEIDPFEERLMKDVHTEQGSFSEVLLRGKSGEYAVGRFILDPFSNAVYSTQPNEYFEFSQLQASGVTTIDALKQIANKYYGDVE
jgi:conjugal transfer ATP-binding protein TraC